MIRTIRHLFSFCVFVLFFVSAASYGAEEKGCPAPAVVRKTERPYVRTVLVPEPTLLDPTQPVIDISDKLFVDFRWKPKESPCQVWCYVFRLYRGYETTPVRQIFSKQVSAVTAAVVIPIDYFRDGESYTWSVVQVDPGPIFSEPVCYTFRAIKKLSGASDAKEGRL